jgi:hypothetical protein
MNKIVSDDYCPTHKPPSASLPCASFSACKDILPIPNHVIVFCFLVSIQQLCPKQALLVQNALVWGRNLKADTSMFYATSIFINTDKGNGGLSIWKYFVCHCGQHGIGFNWFLDRNVSCRGNKWRRWIVGRRGKVSYVGSGAECECEDVAHTVWTTNPLRHRHSGDINQPLKNADCIQASSWAIL